jgi:ribosomal protein L32
MKHTTTVCPDCGERNWETTRPVVGSLLADHDESIVKTGAEHRRCLACGYETTREIALTA